MRVPTVRQPCHSGRWETIRYVVDDTPRTVRFCLIRVVLTTSSVLTAAIAIHGGSETVHAVLHAMPCLLSFFR
jgi:hypothetical protein